jgi:hypothetical protein
MDALDESPERAIVYSRGNHSPSLARWEREGDSRKAAGGR